jgi:hypothetical protein
MRQYFPSPRTALPILIYTIYQTLLVAIECLPVGQPNNHRHRGQTRQKIQRNGPIVFGAAFCVQVAEEIKPRFTDGVAHVCCHG